MRRPTNGIRAGLEDARDQRTVDVRDDLDVLALGVRSLDVRDLTGGGHVVDDGRDERLDADVLGGAPDHDRGDEARANGLVDAVLEFGVGDLLALEVLGHDVVVGFRRGFDQLIAAGGDLGGQVGRHGDFDFLAALHFVGLLVDQIHEALEGVRGADRHVQRRDLLPE